MTITTAQNLLLSILSTRADTSRAKLIEQLSISNWNNVIQEAEKHGVAPLVHARIRTYYPNISLPSSIERKLRKKYLRKSGSSILLYNELSKVLEHLKNNDMPVIVLKGPHLAEAIYGNRAVRPMNDFDLLFRKDDLTKIGKKLEELGYTASRYYSVEAECAVHSDFPAYIKPGSIGIEVHWTLESPKSPFNIDIDGIWQRAWQAKIAGVDTCVLSIEDLILHLCIHASYHHRLTFGLLPFCDITATLSRYQKEIDWELLIHRAYQWRAGNTLYLTLLLTRDLMDADVPEAVLEELEPNNLDPEVLNWAQEQIFSAPVGSLLMTYNLSRLWGNHRFQYKAATLLQAVFPSPEVMATKYPISPSSKRIYLYYPIRLKDLLFQYGRTSWRLFRRDRKAMAQIEREERGNALVEWLSG